MEGNIFEPALENKLDMGRSLPEILQEKYKRLPDIDKYVFEIGPLILSVNSSFSGLVSNSLFRRTLHVTQARMASTLPMLGIPFITTAVIYEGVVKQPLMDGMMNCSTCTLIRAGLVGVGVGGLYPVVVALPLNAFLATRYNTSPMPSPENMLKYWNGILSPILKKMRFSFLLQFALGTYLGSEHYRIYVKMLKMPDPRKDPEELYE